MIDKIRDKLADWFYAASCSLGIDHYETDVTSLYDETGWPTEIDNEDESTFGERPF